MADAISRADLPTVARNEMQIEADEAARWLTDLQVVPEDPRRRSFNGVRLDIGDVLEVARKLHGTGVRVTSEIHAPRAIAVDIGILGAALATYARGTEPVVAIFRDDPTRGELLIEIGAGGPPLPAQARWVEFVAEDLFGGTMTERGIELPLSLGAGDG